MAEVNPALALALAEQERRRRASASSAAPPAPAAPPPQPPSFSGGFGDAARIMANDVTAGFQGVNPIRAARAIPLGVVTNGVVIGEGFDRPTPLAEIDGRQYATQVGEDGKTYVYGRDALRDHPLASAGRMLGYGVMSGGGPAVRAAGERVMNLPPSQAVQAAQDVERLDVMPSLGMRGSTGARVAGSLEAFAPSGGVVVDDARRAATEIGEAAARTAARAGGAGGRVDAGEALKAGANLFAQRSSDIGGRLYSEVGRKLPEGTAVAMPETSRVLSELSGRFADRPALARQVGAQQYAGLLEDAAQGLSWGQASEWRTSLLDATRKIVGPFASIPDGQKKRLVQAITADMEATARAAGPDAFRSWTRARDFWAKRSDRVEKALAKVFKADSAEKAFEDVFAMAGETSRGNIRSLEGIKNSMPPAEWGDFVSAVVLRMGRANPGAQDAAGEVFSPRTFLSNWNKIAPEAKMLMFEGKGMPSGLRAELDTLARVAERAADAGAEVNKSRTFATGSNMLMAGATATNLIDPLTAIGTAGGAYTAAKIMTSRPLVRAITRYYASGSPDAIARLARSNAPIAAEAGFIMRALEGQGAQPSQ
jgi:hypothetical protein